MSKGWPPVCEYEIVTYQVGDLAEGGIVFYVDETGEHGLVAAMEDLEGAFEWGCYSGNVDGADGLAIGTGYQNTIDIVNDNCLPQDGGITAAQAALDAEINGYSDWYLPSQNELVEMYYTIGNEGPEGNIGGFETNYVLELYWSSSEINNYNARTVSFDTGDSIDEGGAKHNLHSVRVIRSF